MTLPCAYISFLSGLKPSYSTLPIPASLARNVGAMHTLAQQITERINHRPITRQQKFVNLMRTELKNQADEAEMKPQSFAEPRSRPLCACNHKSIVHIIYVNYYHSAYRMQIGKMESAHCLRLLWAPGPRPRASFCLFHMNRF